MKKNQFVLIVVVLMFMMSCTNGEQDKSKMEGADTATALNAGGALGSGGSADSFSAFIPKDSANKMITSYLNSIGDSSSSGTGNDTDLRSLIVDVKALNSYINQTSTTGFVPVKMKMFFAHTLEYINSGHGNQKCGYRSGKLTMVLALYDSAGNYIYMNGNSVLDNMQPCPQSCPTIGAAANNTLTQ